MPARVLTYVTINGVDVSSKVINWKFVDTFGNEIPDVSIQLAVSVDSLVTLENGQEVIIKRGTTTSQDYNVFAGNIDSIDKGKPFYNVKAKDKLIQLVKCDVNVSFDKDIDTEAGIASEIANTLITTYGGLSTNSGATVVSTGTDILLTKFLCRKTDIFERVRTIADIFDYQIYYNYDDGYVYFEPNGYTTNANNLTVGSNVSNIPEWQFDNTQLVNQIRVDGAESLVETTETGQIGVTSGYTTSSVTLTKQPFSVKVYADAANPPTTLKTGGVVNSTSSFDYSVDVENKKIIWSSTFTPGGSDYVEVRYSYPAPIPIIRKRQGSIDSYGLSSTTRRFSDVKSVEDAISRGDLYLDTYSEPFVRVKLHVPSIANNYKAGEKVRIIDNYNNEDRTLVINKIEKNYPHKYDILHCGNKEYALAEYNRLTLDKIKRLEEELTKNDDLIIQIIDLVRTFKPRRRYFKRQRSKIFDSFILSHYINGLLGMGEIVDNLDSKSASYTGSAGIILADEGTTKMVGSGSLSVQFTSTGSQTITTTQSFGDLSSYTGQSSGTPSQGTVGMWWYSPNTTGITAITLRIGSGASDYIECTGREYGSVNGYNNWGSLAFALRTGWNYYLFDLDNPDSTTGTPDWTAVDYLRVEYTVASTHTGYLDYITISKSNYIGLNGLGDRSQVIDTEVMQGNMTYEERVYDTTFHDSTNSTATFNTGTNTISFTSGQVWYSEVLDSMTTFTQARLTLGTTAGTFTVEISSDNKSTWQTLTDTVIATLSSSDGTGTYIRVTETGASTASITNTTDAYGQITRSAIKVELIQ